MKRIASVLSAAVLLSGVAVTIASAETLRAGVDTDIELNAGGAGASVNAGAQAQATGEREQEQDNERGRSGASSEKGNATSAAARAHDDNDYNDNEGTSTGERSHGEFTSEEHRSSVASFVESLLKVADREKGGIGEEVRVVAHEQEETASTTADAMEEVESRSAFETFLFGSDDEHLGVIRSSIATTSANIEQLTKMREKAWTTADKAEITAQINVLKDQQASLDAYVQAHENVFSLFGWFVKLFGNN